MPWGCPWSPLGGACGSLGDPWGDLRALAGLWGALLASLGRVQLHIYSYKTMSGKSQKINNANPPRIPNLISAYSWRELDDFLGSRGSPGEPQRTFPHTVWRKSTISRGGGPFNASSKPAGLRPLGGYWWGLVITILSC